MIERIYLQSSNGTQWRTEDRACPICQSRKAKRLGARGGRAHREGKGIKTDIVRCSVCDTAYPHPALIPETNPYAKETAKEYFQLHNSQQKVKNGEALATYAETVLGAPGRMLELGCGRGELLVGALNRGWTAFGVEMTETYAQVARLNGVEVECITIQDCKSLDVTYDVILLAAVLEHLYDPIETLVRIGKALRPGGLLFIDVPNESSLAMRIGNIYMRMRGKDWAINLSPTFAPYHVVGFSPISLQRALSSTGFRIHKLEVIKWKNALPQGNSFGHRIEQLALGIVQSVGKHIGMGDGITCWAIKE